MHSSPSFFSLWSSKSFFRNPDLRIQGVKYFIFSLAFSGYLSGIDFLEHKKLIKERIERLEISVEKENIEQITSVI